MATTRPFAYNTGTTIDGTTQFGNLAIGNSQVDYSLDYGGVKWWMGPDEDLGYVIAHENANGNQPNPIGSSAYVQFWRTTSFTDNSFLILINSLPARNGLSPFTNTYDGYSWLTTNGYWTTFIEPSPNQTPTPTPSVTNTQTPSITPTNTITPTSSVTPTITLTNTVTPTVTITPSITPTNSVTPTITPTVTTSSTIQPVSNSYFYYDPGNVSSYVSGTTLYDLSGNNRNATISNSPTYTSGTGGYFTFDGVNDYITSPNAYNAGNSAHTLEIWIRPTAVDDCLWSDTGTQTPNADYHSAGGQIFQTGPFQQIISCLWATTEVSRTVNGAGTFTNTWIQVVKTYSGTTLTGYINGTAGSPSTITWFPPWNQAANSWYMHFGATDTTTYNASTAGYFAGRYGIIRFYNRALTSSEVAQNFNADKTKYGL